MMLSFSVSLNYVFMLSVQWCEKVIGNGGAEAGGKLEAFGWRRTKISIRTDFVLFFSSFNSANYYSLINADSVYWLKGNYWWS